MPSKDGLIHQLLYVFEFADLGRVVVDELSYETAPDTPYVAIGKPFGNISVGSVDGTYIVERNETGDKGRSSVHIAINGKLFRMTADKAFTKGSQEWHAFRELASYFN